MKHFAKLLIVPLLAFFSCSQQMDDLWEENEPPKSVELQSVGVCFSRASLETFAEQGITEIGIYAYLKDSLVFGKNLPVNGGNLKVDLPLGENLQTFAIANASRMVDTDSLSKVTVYQDGDMQKLVYISDIIDFTSDKSVDNLELELKRLVGQALFQPTETADELNAITQFDQMDLTFTNVGIGYKVKSGECIQQNVTVKADRSTGFSVSVYSLPTLDGSSRTSIDVIYLKGNMKINRTNSHLDTSIAFEPSKRSVVYMPILEDAYLENPWTRTRMVKSADVLTPPFTIEESEF